MKALTQRQRLALQAVQLDCLNDYTRGSVPSLIRRGLVISEWRGDRTNATYYLTSSGREALAQ